MAVEERRDARDGRRRERCARDKAQTAVGALRECPDAVGDHFWILAAVGRRTSGTEIGHLLMNRTDCYLAWGEAITKDTLSVSHYGRLNPSEDFAEFVRLFLSTEGDDNKLQSLRRLFPTRMGVLDTALKKVNFEWKY